MSVLLDLFGIRPRELPPAEGRLKTGEIVCPNCRGRGVYRYAGIAEVGCHICTSGVTTRARYDTQMEWERHCHTGLFGFADGLPITREAYAARGDEIMVRYRASVLEARTVRAWPGAPPHPDADDRANGVKRR